MWLPIVGAIVEKVVNLIDKHVEDKDLALRLKAEIQSAHLVKEYNLIAKELDARREIIVAETKSESSITRSWRPILMLLFGLVIFNKFFFLPYFTALTGADIQVVIPDPMWDIIKLGTSGYLVGRSVEKVVREWKKSNK